MLVSVVVVAVSSIFLLLFRLFSFAFYSETVAQLISAKQIVYV